MHKFTKSSILVLLIIMVAVIAAGCSSRFVPQGEVGTDPSSLSPDSSNEPTNGLVQSNTGGSVTIDVEWVRAENNSLVFDVAMNTHSVDLDQYNLDQLTTLRDDVGDEYYPISWDSAPGGHHRRGTLTFTLPDSLSNGEAKYVEMIIRDVADITERVLRWEL